MNLARILSRVGFLAMTFFGSACSGQVLNYSDAPQPKDNFLEANFRYVNPDPSTSPKYLMVYVPGTDGDARGIVEDPKFLAACKICHAALIGCCYRGEGMRYDIPDGGSGRALDDAIAYFAQQSDHPELRETPLLLIGYSQGAAFALNYACWQPQRLHAFAALKTGSFHTEPQPASFQVPGIIVAGEQDEPERIRSATKAFLSATGAHSRWTFLLEKNAGHDLTRSLDFARQFVESVCQKDDGDAGVYFSAEKGHPTDSSSTASDTCWFPDNQTADAWSQLHQTTSLQALLATKDVVGLSNVLNVMLLPEIYECENDQSVSGIVKIGATGNNVLIGNVSIAGDGFTLDNSDSGSLPTQLKIHFAPRKAAWGHVSGNLVIEGTIDGRGVVPLEVTIPAMVKGPVRPVPSMAYLGTAQPSETVDQTVVLKSDQPGIRVAEVKAPKDITVTVEPKGDTNAEYEMQIHWKAGNRLGRYTGEIRLTFESCEGELIVPVVGVVAPKS